MTKSFINKLSGDIGILNDEMASAVCNDKRERL